MRRFYMFQALWMSFFSKELYRDVARHWSIVAGFFYLLFLIALSWIPFLVQMYSPAEDSDFERVTEGVIRQLPEITIRDGKAIVEPPAPRVITDPETGKELAIIDTSGGRTGLEDTEAVALLTETQFFMKRERDTRIYELKQFEPFITRIDQDVARQWTRFIKNWMGIAFYALATPFSFLYRAAQAIVYAAIGMVLSNVARASLSYAALLRLSTVAVTPAVVVATVTDMAGMGGFPVWLTCFLVAMGYLFFAVKSTVVIPEGVE